MRRPLQIAVLVLALLFVSGSQLALGAPRTPPKHRAGTIGGTRHRAHLGGAIGAHEAGGTGRVKRSIVQTDRMWVCKGPVNLDSVTVTMTPASIGARRDEDAIHLESGCTGRIGQINVVQWAADGVKAAQGAHDLTIGSGSITCLGKAPNLHQDGVQVMGGSNITFSNMTINCGRFADRLIDSNFFVKQAGSSTAPPSDVVCDHCTFGGWTAHTVNVESSIRSGVTDSRLCVGRFPKLTFTIGADAVSPVDSGNTVAKC